MKNIIQTATVAIICSILTSIITTRIVNPNVVSEVRTVKTTEVAVAEKIEMEHAKVRYSYGCMLVMTRMVIDRPLVEKELLEIVPGINSVQAGGFDRYAFQINKSQSFTWEEITPLVDEYLQNYKKRLN